MTQPTLAYVLSQPPLLDALARNLDPESLNVLRRTSRALRERLMVRTVDHPIHADNPPRLRMELPVSTTPEKEAAARQAAAAAGGGDEGGDVATAVARKNERARNLAARRTEVMYEITPLSEPDMMYNARAMIVETPEALRHLVATASRTQAPYRNLKTLILRDIPGRLENILFPAPPPPPDEARALPPPDAGAGILAVGGAAGAPPGVDLRDLAVRGAADAPLVVAGRLRPFPNLQHLELDNDRIDWSLFAVRATLRTLSFKASEFGEIPVFHRMFEYNGHMIAWPELRRLKVDGDLFADVFDPAWITNHCLPKLADLTLGKDGWMPGIPSMPRLKRLEIRVEQEHRRQFLETSFPRLEKLALTCDALGLADFPDEDYPLQTMPRLRHLTLNTRDHSLRALCIMARSVQTLHVKHNPATHDTDLIDLMPDPAQIPDVVSLKKLKCGSDLFFALYKTTTIASTLEEVDILDNMTSQALAAAWSDHGVFAHVVSVKFGALNMNDDILRHLVRLFPNVRELTLESHGNRTSLNILEELEHLRAIRIGASWLRLMARPSDRIARMLRVFQPPQPGFGTIDSGTRMSCGADNGESYWVLYNTVALDMKMLKPEDPLLDLSRLTCVRTLFLDNVQEVREMNLGPVAYVPSLALQCDRVTGFLPSLQPLRSTRVLKLLGWPMQDRDIGLRSLPNLVHFDMRPATAWLMRNFADAWRIGWYPALRTVVWGVPNSFRPMLQEHTQGFIDEQRTAFKTLFSDGDRAVTNIFLAARPNLGRWALWVQFRWDRDAREYKFVTAGRNNEVKIKQLEQLAFPPE